MENNLNVLRLSYLNIYFSQRIFLVLEYIPNSYFSNFFPNQPLLIQYFLFICEILEHKIKKKNASEIFWSYDSCSHYVFLQQVEFRFEKRPKINCIIFLNNMGQKS